MIGSWQLFTVSVSADVDLSVSSFSLCVESRNDRWNGCEERVCERGQEGEGCRALER